MNEPRAPLESEVSNLIGFLDKNLRPTAGWSIAAEYPSVFTPLNLANIRVITENDTILAHAAMKYLLIKNVFGLFKVAAIGSVVTEPSHRGQGLSQKIIQSCLEAAHKESADFAILWTDLYDFYRRMGFELAGTEVSIVIETAPPPPQTNLKFLKTDKVSPEAILRLYSQHTCGSLRNPEDVKKFLSIPNSNIYTAWSTGNELLAYAVEGKGADLRGYIHEWGGGVNHLLPLFSFVRREHNAPITVIAPPHAQNLLRSLQEWNVISHEGFLGMIRPVHTDNLFFKIKRYARQLGMHDLVLEASGTGFVIGRKSDVAHIATIGELTRLLFGPIDHTQLKPEYQKLFPIPMWVWGWDSI